MPDHPALAEGHTFRNQASARPPFARIALLLQGGGALGAYQGGVYEALTQAGLQPDWVAGISIGAINAALIAGNPPAMRVKRLREFWDTVSRPRPGLLPLPLVTPGTEMMHRLLNQAQAFGNALFGTPGFFSPRPLPPFLSAPGTAAAVSYYDVGPLTETLNRLIDFDLINAGQIRFSVGAVNVRTGNFTYFDNTTDTITAAHVLASGALPPGFPGVEIDGELYWDGGLVSNTPLDWVLESSPRQDTLAFQIDLWNARGAVPQNLMETDTRQKEIRFSSRTRAGTNQFKKMQLMRRATARLLEAIPAPLRHSPEAELLATESDHAVFNIIQLIYRTQKYESTSKDYDFSRLTMQEHWAAGLHDAQRTLSYPEVLQRPQGMDGVFTFDLGEHEPV